MSQTSLNYYNNNNFSLLRWVENFLHEVYIYFFFTVGFCKTPILLQKYSKYLVVFRAARNYGNIISPCLLVTKYRKDFSARGKMK